MGKVVNKKPQNSAEVVLRSSHCDLYGNGRLGVTVATRKDKYTQFDDRQRYVNSLQLFRCDSEYMMERERLTYNLCMRETMVLNAAWMSAVVQVQTTGRWWFCSISERY